MENIFETGDVVGSGDVGLELIGQQIALDQRFQNRIPAIIQISQTNQTFADACHHHFIQQTGGFLAIPGDERHRRAFGEQFGGGQHLARLDFQFTGDFLDMGFVHLRNGRMV